jgi:hypothetical protein
VLADRLDDRELENLVCVYLQNRHGYLLRPASRLSADIDGEWVFRDRDHHEALIRARHGHASVPRDSDSLPTNAVDRVFVFSPTDTYGPHPAPNVTEIEYADIVEFIRTERWSLPQGVGYWVDRVIDA